MKLTALRVRELGCFREAVAVEGLSGALDVLAGPNESGKSTLLRALGAAFGESHATASTKLKEQLLPYAGGAPLVEVEFTTGEGDWRLRKRFFTGRMAELRNLRSGEILRNADAEERLKRLLDRSGMGGMRGALWVEQRAAFDTTALGSDAVEHLQAVIAREVSAAVAGGRLQAVRTMAAKALDELVSGQRESRRGAYKDATARLDDLSRELEAARKAARDAEERMTALGQARQALATLDAPEAAAERAARLASARKALAEAREASGQRRLAEAEWRRLDQQREAAVKADEALAAQLAELARLTSSGADAGLEDARRKLAAARAAAEAAGTARTTAARGHDTARQAEIAALADTEVSLRTALAGNPVDRAVIDEIETLARQIATLAAELSAAGPVIAMDYERGAEGKVRRDGAPLPGATEITLEGPTELAIKGVGRLRIRPGASASTDAARRRHVEISERLRRLLDRAEAKTPEDARQRHGERITITGQLERIEARRKALGAEARPTGRGPALAASSEAALARLENETMRQETSLRQAVDGVGEAGEALRAAESDVFRRTEADAEGRARLAALSAAVPPEAERDGRRRALAEAAAAATKVAGEALLVLEAWRGKEPAAADLAKLEAAAAAAESAEAAATARRRQLEIEMARLESSLDRDIQDGVGERLSLLTERHQAAEAELAAIAARVRALRLLVTTLAAVDAESEAHIFKPVVDRMTPYVRALWPEAAVDLATGFAVGRITRTGVGEKPERLSVGTQEQVAVLARLGFAALVAERGEALPVILDDALVYSDDERVTRLFGILDDASRRHQVIVFTCRTRSWQGLGGHRLALTPWRTADGGGAA